MHVHKEASIQNKIPGQQKQPGQQSANGWFTRAQLFKLSCFSQYRFVVRCCQIGPKGMPSNAINTDMHGKMADVLGGTYNIIPIYKAPSHCNQGRESTLQNQQATGNVALTQHVPATSGRCTTSQRLSAPLNKAATTRSFLPAKSCCPGEAGWRTGMADLLQNGVSPRC